MTDHKLAHVTVSVPASTSNLGPGFDCLGLALGLRNELTVELWKNPGPTVVHITGEGQGSLPLNEKNLLVQSAYRALPRHLPGRLVFRALNRIPLARGLGSSAAAAVAGLWAGARLLAHCRFSDEELERMAVDLEGHPDNVAPCVHGGLTASLTVNSQPRSVKLKIHPSLSSVVCIPSFELATKKARAALPRTVTLADATHNTSRAILLVRALENGRIEHLNELMDDRLHQPYRAKLVPGLAQALHAAVQRGAAGAALSGSGPTLFALIDKKVASRSVGHAMQKAFATRKIQSHWLALNVERKGVIISHHSPL